MVQCFAIILASVELDLVDDSNTARSDEGYRRLTRRGARDGVPRDADETKPFASVEAVRIEVVVGDEPDARAVVPRRHFDDHLEQRTATAAGHIVIDRDDLRPALVDMSYGCGIAGIIPVTSPVPRYSTYASRSDARTLVRG